MSDGSKVAIDIQEPPKGEGETEPMKMKLPRLAACPPCHARQSEPRAARRFTGPRFLFQPEGHDHFGPSGCNPLKRLKLRMPPPATIGSFFQCFQRLILAPQARGQNSFS